KLVQELQPVRDLSRNPMFQVVFHLFNAPNWDTEDLGRSSSAYEPAQESAIFDLVLTLMETHDGLNGAFEFNVDLFESYTITRLAGHFETLLQSIVDRPDQSILELPLLSPAERQLVIKEWNNTDREDEWIDVITRFENQASKTPTAVAFNCGHEEL